MTKPKNTQLRINGAPPVIAAGGWPAASAPICNSTQTERYDGRELRPFAGRPGSLDFLGWPSRTAGGLVYRGEA